MGDTKGFLKVKRKSSGYRPVCERINDFKEVAQLPTPASAREQAARCMDCGTPFCHSACPVGNQIPEWNDFVFQKRWKDAYEVLQSTNNFPEFTGRLCPALCEYSCVLGINDDPVTIRENELAVIEQAFAQGFVVPRPPRNRTGKKVAVIGSGPAGLACADQLNKAGHTVVVFERDQKAGGILRYGIPDFKMDKRIIDRRLDILTAEGIEISTGVDVGRDVLAARLRDEFDAVCITGGSRIPRDLAIEGRDLGGVHFAMDYLVQMNRQQSAEDPSAPIISAKGKSVVVIGGGDTGSDCVGTAHRQKAACVIQIELMPKPPSSRTEDFSWPRYPFILKTTSSHEEGGDRKWAILTKKFIGEQGKVKKIQCVEVEMKKDAAGAARITEVPGSEFEITADLVILALGFVHPEKKGLIHELGVELDERGNVRTDPSFMTSVKGVFAAGDMRRGQSLIVWTIIEGRRAAYHIDAYLMGRTLLAAL